MQKKKELYVITAGLAQSFKNPSKCYDNEGKITTVRKNFAAFDTFSDAQNFAKKYGIKVDNVVNYIYQCTFYKEDGVY